MHIFTIMKKAHLLLISILLLVTIQLKGQKHIIDSLIKLTQNAPNDSLKANAFSWLSFYLEAKDELKAKKAFEEALKIAEKRNDLNQIGEIHRVYAHFFLDRKKDFSNALKHYNFAIENFHKTNNYNKLVECYNNVARQIYEPLELIDEEKNALKKCVQYAKLTPSGVSAAQYYVLGWFEANIGDADSAIAHLGESYRVCMHDNKNQHNGFSTELMMWIGNAYGVKKDHHKALEYQMRAAEICDSSKNEWQYHECIRYAASSYQMLKQLDSSIYLLKKVTDYMIKNKTKDRMYYIGAQLIRLYTKTNNLAEAEKYVKILTDTTEINYKLDENYRRQMDISLFHFYRAKNDYKNAVNYLIDFQVLKDSLDNRKARANIGEQALKYEFQKQQEQDKLEQQQKDFESQDKLKKQKLFNYAMLVVVVFVGLMLFMAYRNIKQRKEAFKEISLQKEEVEKQKAIVETKNKEIHDSINYAKRLQEAILPNNTYIQSHFNDSFIFYKPKDIVAGDFYFFEKHNDQLIIAAGDCTGHGVPGALVSVVCSNALTRSVKEFGLTEPGKILDKTRELVVETFERSQSDVKDGMDISLISVRSNKGKISDDDTITISWAGANNPLWYIDNKELKEIKPHKQPIGKTDNPTQFPTHEITLRKGDTIYLITDGFADQFGGPKGKKFKYKHLQELILENSNISLDKQLSTIDESFTNWKGNLEQVDDVTLIALRF